MKKMAEKVAQNFGSQKAIEQPWVIITNGLEWFWNDLEKRLTDTFLMTCTQGGFGILFSWFFDYGMKIRKMADSIVDDSNKWNLLAVKA